MFPHFCTSQAQPPAGQPRRKKTKENVDHAFDVGFCSFNYNMVKGLVIYWKMIFAMQNVGQKREVDIKGIHVQQSMFERSLGIVSIQMVYWLHVRLITKISFINNFAN